MENQIPKTPKAVKPIEKPKEIEANIPEVSDLLCKRYISRLKK